MKEIEFNIDYLMQTSEYWIGAYGGHYTAVCIFKEYPKNWLKDGDDEYCIHVDGMPHVDVYQEGQDSNIVACMDDYTFDKCFGYSPIAKHIEITSVEKVIITLPIIDGEMMNIISDIDGWMK